MKTKKQKSKTKTKHLKTTCYNKLPIRVTQNEFNTYVKPHLSKGRRGPKTKISYYKIFNYILYVLHTGIQWDQLLTCRNEIYWTNVYKHHNRWSKDGSYENLFKSSVEVLGKLGKLDLSLFHIDGSNVVAKKGGEKIGYSGHKHQKGDKNVPICDNVGNIVAPMPFRPVNVHDSLLFDQSFTNLLEIIDELNLDVPDGAGITGDPGFDSAGNKNQIITAGFSPIIKPNLRGLKNQEKINRILDEFEEKKPIYKERYKIERCNAWQDKYRKVVVRYEKLQCTAVGFHYLAYSMVNFRWVFGKNR